jgi:hypothetical protein
MVEIDPRAVGVGTGLPYEIERYFLPTTGAFLLSLELLILTHMRPRGIASAALLMRAAYECRYPRRAPVTVRPHVGGNYLVEDGNSTVLNAIASAWPNVLCIVGNPESVH